ncbi:MAG: electron transport complex protein RnfA [Porticoccaceae bacterium]
MQEVALVLLSTVLVNNVLLAQTLGVSSLLGMSAQGMSAPGKSAPERSSRLDRVPGLAAATGLLLVASAAVNHLLYHWLLVPLDLGYLALPVFVLVIVLATQLMLTGSRRLDLRYHRNLKTLQPLLMANAAILGVTLLNVADTSSLALAILRALGAGVGFSVVLVLFAGLREQLTAAAMPAPFRGPAIAMISAGLMALAFMGFVGMV